MQRLLMLLLLLCLFGAGCASLAPQPTPPSVLLVSIDGMRAQDLTLGLTPNLARIARDGVQADWMTPSYPTLTFPNHYTLVTGLRPDHHGIVHNWMHDAALGRFRHSDAAATGDGRWWSGEPIWVGAEKAGLPTAIMIWPGSEAAIGGVRPTRWTSFDARPTPAARVDTVLAWLSEPAATRPRFAALYFETLDAAAHEHGPESPQARAAIAELDAQLGRLLDGLTARGLDDTLNLIVVSDHGMAAVTPERALAMEDFVDPADAEIVTAGQVIGIAPRPGREAQIEQRLLGRHPHHQCWRRASLPTRWQYGTHPRVPAIVCQMDEGWTLQPRARIAAAAPGTVTGAHGYEPTLPSMRAIFFARGPAFRAGTRLHGFDNVDVYPLLAHLLAIPPAPNDGDAATWTPVLIAPP